MGLYINPMNISKEQWLLQHTTKTFGRTPPSSINDVADDEAIVCLVDNGPFTAAAVTCTQHELEVFLDPDDQRPKAWFVVKKNAVKDVCPDYSRYMK